MIYLLHRLGRLFVKGFEAYVRQTQESLNPIHDVELPEGEELCRTCLGSGGWSVTVEGEWFVCPTCRGAGTIPIT